MSVEPREPWAQHCSFGPGGHSEQLKHLAHEEADSDRVGSCPGGQSEAGIACMDGPRGLMPQPVRFNHHWVSLGVKNDDGDDGDNMMIANVSLLKATRFSRYTEHRSRSVGCDDISHFTEGHSRPGLCSALYVGYLT